ncbi:MAG: hypothetical protein AMXMBFR33_01990 [Candidatus Xenobia bacterium]
MMPVTCETSGSSTAPTGGIPARPAIIRDVNALSTYSTGYGGGSSTSVAANPTVGYLLLLRRPTAPQPTTLKVESVSDLLERHPSLVQGIQEAKETLVTKFNALNLVFREELLWSDDSAEPIVVLTALPEGDAIANWELYRQFVTDWWLNQNALVRAFLHVRCETVEV